MDIKDFFNKIDDTARSKEIEQEAKEALSRINTENAVIFAQKLSEQTKPYEIEFSKRGFKCEKREGNLPYWSLEIRNPTTEKKIRLAIVSGQQTDYEVAVYKQDQRAHCVITISADFEKEAIDLHLQNLFSHLV